MRGLTLSTSAWVTNARGVAGARVAGPEELSKWGCPGAGAVPSSAASCTDAVAMLERQASSNAAADAGSATASAASARAACAVNCQHEW